ncbi:MAG: dTDP-4-dehydrorhamnose reductase [Gemmatimonadetes bacterium]|nr:dTDP-4-dehydrorhamnose reductase [Gemmatimonadota bacterium]
MRILVTGAGGLLGRAVVADARGRGHEVEAVSHPELDVVDEQAVERALARSRPDAVFHCAAYTAVDRAESEPDEARAVNVEGTRHVARAASGVGAQLLSVSTDYVFDGRKRTPYLPDDDVGPLSVYGRTKLDGERAALAAAPSALVVRTSWLYGDESGFVPAILRRASRGERLRVVDDQGGRPTWAPHAAAAMLDLLERRARGIWHVAGGGECTRLELAREALQLARLGTPIEAISTVDFGSPARRPAYSVLDLTATETLLGRPMTHWRDALATYLRSRSGHAAEGSR